MFSYETLRRCSVIQIHDLLPKKIKTSDFNSSPRDGFLFLARTESKLLVYQNLGFEPTEIEIKNLKKYISTWGGGENAEISNGVLEMELPSFLIPFENELNSIPGCRISPNLLRIEGDVYLTVEYHDTVNREVSEAIMKFISGDHLFKKKLIYTGTQSDGLPYILKLYKENGNSLDNLFMITTVWEFEENQIKTQNLGVFQNTGNYLPKCFVNGVKDELIFKVDNLEILGSANYRVVDAEEKIVEMEVTSRFFSDFYNEVIRKYSGPIFCHMEVSETEQTSYYLVEMDHQTLFMKGLLNHWKKDARVDHKNYIKSAEKLSSFVR